MSEWKTLGEDDGWEDIPEKPQSAFKTALQLMIPQPLRAAGETALAVGSGFGGMVLGGLAGTGRTILSGPEEGAKTAERVSHALTYEPDSPTAQKVLGTVGNVVDTLWSEPNRRAGGIIAEASGSPALGRSTSARWRRRPMSSVWGRRAFPAMWRECQRRF